MTRRLSLMCVVAALGALVSASPPAAASHDTLPCVDLATAGLPYARVTVCVTADTGLYEPVYVSCNAIYGCWAKVTTGHRGSASLEGEVCVEVLSGPPLCTGLGTGDVPLVTIPPQAICFNDSPWGPPCEPDVEE